MNYKKFENIIILNNSSIRDAIIFINKHKQQFCLVKNKSQKIIGSITDGDLRRYFLKNKNLNGKVDKIMNKKFKFIYEDNLYLKNKKQYLKKYAVDQLPVLNKKGLLVDYITNRKKSINVTEDELPVLIFAGGYGNRLKPLTDSIPKPLVKVNGKPMLETLINNLEFHNLNKITLALHHMSDKIKKYFKNGKKFNVKISYLFEKKPLGTAGSIYDLKNIKYKNILILNSDIFTNLDFKKMFNFHLEKNNDITVLSVKNKNYLNFGVIKSARDKILKINEKPYFEHDICGGIYIIKSNIIKKILKSKKHTNMNNFINLAIQKKLKVKIYRNNYFWSDLGTLEEIINVEKNYNNLINSNE